MNKCELKQMASLRIDVWGDTPAECIPNMDYDYNPARWAGCFPVGSPERFLLAAAVGVADGVEYYRDTDVNRFYFIFTFRTPLQKDDFWRLVRDYVNH